MLGSCSSRRRLIEVAHVYGMRWICTSEVLSLMKELTRLSCRDERMMQDAQMRLEKQV